MNKNSVDLDDLDDAGLKIWVGSVYVNWINANNDRIYTWFRDNDNDGIFEATLDTEWKVSGDWKVSTFT